MENKDYIWTDNPTVSGVSTCDTDILNECLMHLKYNNSNGLPLFFMLTTDRALTGDEGLGWALQGSYVTMTYPDAVNMIISEYNSGVSATYRGISCKRSAGGRYIADISKKEDVDELYTTSGIADIYVVDRTNKAFYLPKTKWFYQYTNDLNNVNKYNEPGLPNHQHSPIYLTGSNADLGDPGTCYMTNNSQQNGVQTSTNSRTGNVSNNNLYGKSSTVQPPSSNKFIYYKVGDVVAGATSALIDAQEYFSDAMQSLEEKTADGLAALSDASTALTRVQITNCILEAPESIKIEYDSEHLTLKAGSVIIVPYGTADLSSDYPAGSTFIHNNFEVAGTSFVSGKFFVYASVRSDITISDFNELIFDSISLIFVTLSSNRLDNFRQPQCSSGTTTPASGQVWYNTADNKILAGTFPDSIGTAVLAFPVLEFLRDAGELKSVNSVFNTCGYIGSTVFVNKGIKVLMPDGKNPDGTLKNVEYLTPTVSIQSVEDLSSAQIRIMCIQSGSSRATMPNWEYNPDINYICGTGSDNLFQKYVGTMVGKATVSDGKITSFKPYNTFHAIDYNEAGNKANRDFSNVTKPYVTQTYINGTSWYRVWSDGWIEQGGRAVSFNTVTLPKTFKNTNYTLQMQIISGEYCMGVTVSSINTNSFYFGTATHGGVHEDKPNVTCMWYACGF